MIGLFFFLLEIRFDRSSRDTRFRFLNTQKRLLSNEIVLFSLQGRMFGGDANTAPIRRCSKSRLCSRSTDVRGEQNICLSDDPKSEGPGSRRPRLFDIAALSSRCKNNRTKQDDSAFTRHARSSDRIWSVIPKSCAVENAIQKGRGSLGNPSSNKTKLGANCGK